VVIPTYQRREHCARAVSSALDQELPALEVLVCDDGSTDGTREAMEAWAGEEERLRYLRLPRNHGNPIEARNLGVRTARGDWIALLDSDDRWLPEKLARQVEALDRGGHDVIASNATRSSGGPYFPGRTEATEPVRDEFLVHNPIITSTALVRRSQVLAAGGFRRSALRVPITGVDEYALWLAIANQGGRFLVLPEQLVIYDDDPTGLGSNAPRQETEVAAVRWRLWLDQPLDGAVLRSAVRGTVDAVRARRRR
jgi:glycosyltransferase involved in cell wall biosynthesis